MAYAFSSLRIPLVRVSSFAAICRCLGLAREVSRKWTARAEPAPLAISREHGCDRGSQPDRCCLVRALDYARVRIAEEELSFAQLRTMLRVERSKPGFHTTLWVSKKNISIYIR
jgi:hypothetical protein